MLVKNIDFNNVTFGNITENKKSENTIKSDFVRTQNEDNFQKEEAEKSNKETRKNKSGKTKRVLKSICIGFVSFIVLCYGGVVLNRKLSKPTFNEIQKCFKEIFEKDLTKDQIKDLVQKYKEICKNKNTEEFTKQIIGQLKKDYGIEQVETELNVIKLADNKLSTALNHFERGSASPLAKIDIKPRTSRDNIIRSIQADTFATGFHEMKHIKQFADAYRADPEKFAEAIYKHNIQPEDFKNTVQEAIRIYEESIAESAKLLKNGDDKMITSIYEDFQKDPQTRNISKKQIKDIYKNLSIDEIIQYLKNSDGANTSEKIQKKFENDVEKSFIDSYRKLLDARYGKLERYKEGSEEYKKGIEYIEAYLNYPNPKTDYNAYRKNLLEKEAWHIGDLAKKIFEFSSSIWKL